VVHITNFIKEKANLLSMELDAAIAFLQATEHEMIENHMIKEDKPRFPVANALVAPMKHLEFPLLNNHMNLLSLQEFFLLLLLLHPAMQAKLHLIYK